MKVFWFLCSNLNNPSSRIQGFNIHNKLRDLGYSSYIVYAPKNYSNDVYLPKVVIDVVFYFLKKEDVIVFQKLYGEKTMDFARMCKKKGVKTIFIDCDLPLKMNIALIVDNVICPSDYLKNKYNYLGVSSVKTIHDSVEFFKEPTFGRSGKKRLVWFGKSGNGKWAELESFKRNVFTKIQEKWEFITISDHPDSTFGWNLKNFPNQVNACDLAVIPFKEKEENFVKSSNRCTQAMGLGVPVLSNYLDSYNNIVKKDFNGLISNDENEWIEFIKKCEDDEFLFSLKKNAYNTSLKFSIDTIIEKWLEMLSLNPQKKSSSFWLDQFLFFLKFYLKIRFYYSNIILNFNK